jgi:hypothetical protein
MDKIQEITDSALAKISNLEHRKKKKLTEKILELKSEVDSYLLIIRLRNSEDRLDLSCLINELEKSLSMCLEDRLDRYKNEIFYKF